MIVSFELLVHLVLVVELGAAPYVRGSVRAMHDGDPPSRCDVSAMCRQLVHAWSPLTPIFMEIASSKISRGTRPAFHPWALHQQNPQADDDTEDHACFTADALHCVALNSNSNAPRKESLGSVELAKMGTVGAALTDYRRPVDVGGWAATLRGREGACNNWRTTRIKKPHRSVGEASWWTKDLKEARCT